MDRIIAWHFSDPGCPWAYSSRPALAHARWRFGDQLEWRLVVIGLSEDTRRMEAAGYDPLRIASGWPKFARRFGMPFGVEVKPRLAPTSRACRAIVAAREIDPDLGEAALAAMQRLQFTTAGVLDDEEDLRAALSTIPGLDADAIVARLDEPDLLELYEADRARTRSAEGTPTHVQGRHANSDGAVRYTAPSVLFDHPDGHSLEVGGFQPFESYDTALANLAPGLGRRGAPESPAEALAAFPRPLATAEVAAIMRGSDLEETDIPGTKLVLTELAAKGEIVCEPAGTDALWRLPVAVESAAALAA
jgi:protein-disulfide isomerase-like protein with CxxC motif